MRNNPTNKYGKKLIKQLEAYNFKKLHVIRIFLKNSVIGSKKILNF